MGTTMTVTSRVSTFHRISRARVYFIGGSTPRRNEKCVQKERNNNEIATNRSLYQGASLVSHSSNNLQRENRLCSLNHIEGCFHEDEHAGATYTSTKKSEANDNKDER